MFNEKLTNDSWAFLSTKIIINLLFPEKHIWCYFKLLFFLASFIRSTDTTEHAIRDTPDHSSSPVISTCTAWLHKISYKQSYSLHISLCAQRGQRDAVYPIWETSVKCLLLKIEFVATLQSGQELLFLKSIFVKLITRDIKIEINLQFLFNIISQQAISVIRTSIN